MHVRMRVCVRVRLEYLKQSSKAWLFFLALKFAVLLVIILEYPIDTWLQIES